MRYAETSAGAGLAAETVTIDAYEAFLRAKVKLDHSYGFSIEESDINPMLKPHQRAIVRWAVEGGRRAIFAAFGLGKTFMQLEILRLITERVGGRALIVAPLGVRQEFRRDAEKLGLSITCSIRSAAS